MGGGDGVVANLFIIRANEDLIEGGVGEHGKLEDTDRCGEKQKGGTVSHHPCHVRDLEGRHSLLNPVLSTIRGDVDSRSELLVQIPGRDRDHTGNRWMRLNGVDNLIWKVADSCPTIAVIHGA